MGSGTLVALGIIEDGNDIDLAVSPEAYETLRREGWKTEVSGGKTMLLHYSFDVGIGYGQWSLEDLLSDAIIIDDIPYASLDKILEWKTASGRPKDLEHIELIREYLARNRT